MKVANSNLVIEIQISLPWYLHYQQSRFPWWPHNGTTTFPLPIAEWNQWIPQYHCRPLLACVISVFLPFRDNKSAVQCLCSVRHTSACRTIAH